MRSGGIVAAAAAGAALIAGCAAKPEPRPTPAPRIERPVPPPPPATPPPPLLDWPDLALTPGAWLYSSEAGGSLALFGPPASEAHFILRCDRARGQVLVVREGGGPGGSLILRTSALERSLAAAPRMEPLASMTAVLSPSDPLLDAIAFSRGRFAVEAEGMPRLVLPAWPEPARVIEDCRS